MGIVFHEGSKTFHLYNKEISYILPFKNGSLGQLYFGRHIRDREDFSHLLELQYRPLSPGVFEEDKFSLSTRLSRNIQATGRATTGAPHLKSNSPTAAIYRPLHTARTAFSKEKSPLRDCPRRM